MEASMPDADSSSPRIGANGVKGVSRFRRMRFPSSIAAGDRASARSAREINPNPPPPVPHLTSDNGDYGN
jgi:hypothetical protein